MISFGVATFYELLDKILGDKGLSQSAFARMVGYAQPNLSQIKSGDRPVPLGRVTAWAKALDIPVGSETWWDMMDAAARTHFPAEFSEVVDHIFDRQRVKASELEEIMKRVEAIEARFPPADKRGT